MKRSMATVRREPEGYYPWGNKVKIGIQGQILEGKTRKVKPHGREEPLFTISILGW